MSLKDIVDLKTQIKVNDDVSFEVRGLSTEDLAILSVDYDKNLEKLFKGTLNFTGLIKEAPQFVAKTIALAADEIEAIEFASKLAFGVQAKALKTIYDLTFPDEDFLGELVTQVTGALQELQEKLESGKEPVVEKPKKEIGKTKS